jgi:AcrR family transcriptional regulator
MGIIERRARQKQEVREKILDAARELFASEGYEAVTMRQIADKIEYTPTTIYGHFKDKAEMLAELCRVDFTRLAQVFVKLAQVRDPIDRIRKLGHGYIEFAVQNPNHYRLMFMTPHPPPTPEEKEAKHHGDPGQDAYAFLRATVAEALAAGRVRPELDDADLIAQVLWAGVHGVASLQIAKCNDGWIDWCPIRKRAELMVESSLRGLVRK